MVFFHRPSENLTFVMHVGMPFQSSIIVFIALQFVSKLIAIYKWRKAPVHRSHRQERNMTDVGAKQIMLCNKFSLLKQTLEKSSHLPRGTHNRLV